MSSDDAQLSSQVVVGAGYTGQRLLAALTGKANRVIGLSRTKHANIPGVESRQIDLDAASPERIDAGSHSTVCYLVPPATDTAPESRLRKLLEVVLMQAPDRLLLISTTGVYGDCKGDWVSEDRPLNPQSDRAKRRAAVEAYCRAWAAENKVSLAIFRVAGIYGPGRVPVQRLKQGFSLAKNQPDGYSNRIHVDDLVSVCVAGMFGTGTGAFNVADGHPLRYRDYFNLVAEIWGLPNVLEEQHEVAVDSVSPGMRSYLRESRKIDNRRLLETYAIELLFPTPRQGLLHCYRQVVTQ